MMSGSDSSSILFVCFFYTLLINVNSLYIFYDKQKNAIFYLIQLCCTQVKFTLIFNSSYNFNFSLEKLIEECYTTKLLMI